jgi:hypothetical protein
MSGIYRNTAVSALGVWAALHYLLAGRTLATDVVPEVSGVLRAASGPPTAWGG